MTEYVGKHLALQYRTPLSGACFHGECWYKCPWCNNSFEAYDVEFERGFRKIKSDYHYGYFQHECGGIVACEWLRKRRTEQETMKKIEKE